mmetsp:Transcript_58327/g.86728  ORF Transcript_58327/g.86728 Transcript_58327/m.86728 type:complete len:213 (-) Transcript_58327:147-785(-)
MEIMDYSLLLGVHLCTGEEKSPPSSPGSVESRRNGFTRSNTPYRREMKNTVVVNCSDVVIIENTECLSLDNKDDQRHDSDDETAYEDESDAGSFFAQISQHDSDTTSEFQFDLCSVFSSSFSPEKYSIMTPNPYSSREDLGIESFRGSGGANAEIQELYFAGIIDILQHYNARKWGETMMRRAAGNNGSAISCVDPVTYADRFVNFMSDLIE